MSCVREASPPLSDDNLRHDIKKRRFLQPLRGLRRIFRRKGRPVISANSDGSVDGASAANSKEQYDSRDEAVETTNLEPAKSHSTSQLTDDQIDNSQRRSLQSTLLSVSHDSVFTSEQRSPDSGSETSLCVHTRLGFPHSSVRAELFEAVRRRRVQENNVSDDEDDGLPRSPASNSPTTADDSIFVKESIVTKSSQSTCSDGSLLSMGSSEIDEESYCQTSSRHSSKLSLYEKRTSTGSDTQHNDRSSNSFNGDASSLSHSAAKHKMAVKPKRNHGAPHKKRQLKTGNPLPTTPEVNEETGSRTGHFVAAKATAAVTTSTTTTTAATTTTTKEKPVANSRHSDEHLPNKQRTEHVHHHHYHQHQHTSVTQINATGERSAFSSTPSKRSSSPPRHISLSPASSFKSSKCRSSTTTTTGTTATAIAGSAFYDDVAPDEPEKDEAGANRRAEDGTSFFSRLLLRRSSKKKKNANNVAEESDSSKNHDYEDVAATAADRDTNGRQSASSTSAQAGDAVTATVTAGAVTSGAKHYPMLRQRVEPLKLLPTAAEPHLTRTKISYSSMVVPVNMDDGDDAATTAVAAAAATTVIDVKRNSVQKSHSFRNDQLHYHHHHHPHTKLPYSYCADTTPSLPANIGLVDVAGDYGTAADENDDVDRRDQHADTAYENDDRRNVDLGNLGRRFVHDETVAAAGCASDANAYEAVNLRVEAATNRNAGGSFIVSPEYGNMMRAISTNNTLNINVNERTELPSTSSVEEVTDIPSKQIQMPEIKVPVPAPRTSLFVKNSSSTRLAEHSESPPPPAEDCVNVTVTEIDDGQKSIISISGGGGRLSVSSELEADTVRRSSSEANADVEDDEEDENEDDDDDDDDMLNPSKLDDFVDDVFEPITESARVEDALPTVDHDHRVDVVAAERSPSPTRQPLLPLTPSSLYAPETVGSPASNPVPTEQCIVAVVTADVSKPPIVAAKPSEKLRLRSIGNRLETVKPQPQPSPPPIIVCDPSAGTMKVNDTVVVMRRKTRELSQPTAATAAAAAKDDEPELMKVFARRSLKLKESDGVDDGVVVLLEPSSSKSRDSDKENEDTNVTPSLQSLPRSSSSSLLGVLDERKKLVADGVLSEPLQTRSSPFVKFQRSVSHDVVVTAAATSSPVATNGARDKRQRCKSTPDDMEKSDRPSGPPAAVATDGGIVADEKPATPFKRIQQRREEWEKRAQQAMKIHGVK